MPDGFVAAGVRCGIKQAGEDLAIVAAEDDAAAAVLTTRNQVVGAPVLWVRRILPRGYGLARGIVINSGCSNACTGPAGLRDAEAMAAAAARRLGTEPRKVLVASTGVIGRRLPMAKVRRGIAAAAAAMSRRHDDAVLRAIMTTDTRQKFAVVQDRLAGRPVTVAGVVKGAGMIDPSLATLIAVITTDAAVSAAALHKALKAAAGPTFNALTVDADTSTSDTLAVFAGGGAGNRRVTARSPSLRKLTALLTEVCGALARAVAADGEGATKLVRVTVRSARSPADARAAAKTVAGSLLVKCAVHGGDPNWGRVAAALGRSPAKVDPDRLTIKIGAAAPFARGRPRKFDLRAVRRHLAGSEVVIDCDLGLGKGAFTAWTCDLSREYVAINADYHT
jgi:glutamate N-acetyltransferase/amino-acid N-acetyltransferase